MKNLLYVTYDGLLDAVAQSQVLPYLKELSKKGFNITVLSFEKCKKDREESTCKTLKEKLKKYKVKWLLLRYHKSPIIPATIFDILQGIFLGLHKIYTRKIHIIHTRGYIAALIGIFLKYITSRRLIFDMRGFWPDEKVDAGAWKKNGMLYFIVKNIERLLITKTDEIVVLTEAAKKYLFNKFPHASITVIPCCVDINMFGIDMNNDILPDKARCRFIITYLGSLGTFYDSEGMIAFFKIFKLQQSKAFFWIVTNSPNKKEEVLFQKSQLDNSDYAVNSLEFRDIPFVLTNTDVSIMFYRRRLSRIGCSPIKFAESLSCGVPVIINSGIGDTERLIRKEKIGVIVDTLTEIALEKAAKELTRLLSEGDVLRNRCRRTAEKYFSLTGGVEKYRHIYQNLLKR